MPKPDMTASEMKNEAQSILEDQDHFIIAYDIVNSKNFRGEARRKLSRAQKRLRREIEDRFGDDLVNYRYSHAEVKTGMHVAKGDAAVVGLSKPEIIPLIVELAKEIFPVRLRWSIGTKTSDKRITSLIK